MPADAPDYVIVGGGASGCVVANRLTADASVAVTLLEAGLSGEEDPAVTAAGRWVSLLGSSYDWGYATQPEPALAGRVVAAPRGRVLGGSSAINAMAYIRGHRLAFDRWLAGGNPGWGHDDLRPLFERAEREALTISACRDPHAGHEAFLAAAAAFGFRADRDHDFNAPDPEGVAGFYRKHLRDGRRQTAAAAYLLPVLARPNLDVRTGARAIRLVLQGGRAVGVEYVRDGRLERVDAGREVVLCAGAIDSPRLLMLSGIGPAAALSRHGITVAADLPGAGANLHDHLRLSIRWRSRVTLPGSSVTAGLFTRTRGASIPDLQFFMGRGLDQPDDVLTLTVSHVQPASRGSVALASADPAQPPLIHPNYLTVRGDVDALIAGVELARALAATDAFRELAGDETEPGAAVTSPAALERFVREQADTIFHLAGTCRMGPASNQSAVVDANLRVHGIAGLRVADASIMPEPINAPTYAACIAIGEKCGDLLSR
jgi:choline dehydrogenase